MKQSELDELVVRHKLWLNHKKGCKKLSLCGANLRWANLRGADLRWANLRGADLRWADLTGANLIRTNLRGADLRWADLTEADLAGADLTEADLTGANLIRTNLRGADLTRADLTRADLTRADLTRADLSNTILDPNNIPNGGKSEWDDAGDGFVFGYRSMSQPYMNGPDYQVGQTYVAPVFSACPNTECHPGLYLCPSPKNIRAPVIRVKTRRADLHSVRNKHRTRRFTVINLMDV